MIPDFRVEGAKHFLQQQAQTTQSASGCAFFLQMLVGGKMLLVRR
jgi:hypothetical protein